MRKFLSIILCFCLIFLSLTACRSESAEKPGGFSIVASIYPMYIALLNLTDNVPDTSVSLMSETQTGCLHNYTLLPGDMKKLETCGIFVINGAGMESFLDRVMENRPELPVVDASEGIQTLEDEGHGEDGHVHESNGHVWTSVTRHIRQVENITEGLCRYDAVHAELYRENCKRYVSELEQLRDDLKQQLEPAAGQPIIAFHEAFSYFAEEAGMELMAVIEEEPDEAPSPQRIQEIVELVKQNNIAVMAVEPDYNGTSARVIAQEADCELLEFDPIVSGDKSASAYLDGMRANAQRLAQAYGGVRQ